MTSPLEDLVMRTMSGPGIVARFGSVFLVVAEESVDVAEPVRTQLIGICRAISSVGADGRALVRRLAGLVAATDTDPPAFCAVAPHGGDLIVFVHGDAEVVVRLRGGEQRISGGESAAWVDRLVTWPADELVVTVPAARQVPAQAVLDLRGGIVPGAGFCVEAASVVPVGAQGPAEPTSEDSQSLEPLPVLDAVTVHPVATQAPEKAELSADHEPPPFAGDMPTAYLAPVDPVNPANAVTVGGIFCSRGHFNDPAGHFCAVCGTGLMQQPRHPVQGARPPLGVLVLDDGLTYVLDDDYVMGREPDYDPDVREGRARPLAIEDPDGGISRAHAEVRLRGWEVVMCDKGSVNGTYIAPPGESVWTPLIPFHPVSIRPGTRVQVGRRTFVFDSRHNT